MKKIHLLALLLASAALVVNGCKTTGYKQADKTGEGISNFRDEVINVQKAVADSLVALDQLVAQAATDPREAFKNFAKAVGDVESAAKKAKSRADTMRNRGEAYFKEWQDQLQTVANPEIRALAEERREELQKVFSSISDVMQDAKTKFEPFLADLMDLRTFLSTDLTIAGMDAAKDTVGQIRKEGRDVKTAIDKAVEELNKIAALLTPAKLEAGAGAASAPTSAPAE
jgi:hypothetical protein